MRKFIETLQGIFAPRFNTVPALPMGNVPSNELSPHQADLDREFAGYLMRTTSHEPDDELAQHIASVTSGKPIFAIDVPEDRSWLPNLFNRSKDATDKAALDEVLQAGLPTNVEGTVKGLDQDYPGIVQNLERVIDGELVGGTVPELVYDEPSGKFLPAEEPVAPTLADDPNWKTHELASGKTVNDWVGEQSGPGAAFSKLIHNEFYALAWNWHRESAQNGKMNYAKHHRFFYLVGERILAEDWTDIEKLSKFGFTVGQETAIDRAAVVVNDVSVTIDLSIIKLDLEKRKSPWNGVVKSHRDK